MHNLFVSVRFELYKLVRAKLFQYTSIIFLLTLIINGIMIHYHSNTVTINKNWRDELIESNISLTKSLEVLETETIKKNIEPLEILEMEQFIADQMIINHYRLKKSLPPYEDFSALGMVKQYSKFSIVIIWLVSIMASVIVNKEFEFRTINRLLIKQNDRFQIITSKYITVLLYAAGMFVSLFALSYLIGIFIFGTVNNDFTLLHVINGKVHEYSMLGALLKMYGSMILISLFFVTVSFLFSCIFNSSPISTGVTVMMLTLSEVASTNPFFDTNFNLIFSEIDQIPFEIYDASQVQSSIFTIISYTILALALSYFIFYKKNIRV